MEHQKTSDRIYHVSEEKTKRKQREKLKVKGCTEGCYHRIFNHKMELSSDLVQSNTHKGCCMLNTTDCDYKLRSVFGREDDYIANKWT